MRFAAIFMLLVLTGCTTQQFVEKRVAQLAPGVPPTYKTGYSDGCYTVVNETCSSSQAGAARRDTALIKSDRDYALGWNDGVRTCSCAGTAYMFIPLTSD